ncbi:hypothetical protein ACTXND_20820, partial [Brachybacterium tyrofermentans]
MHQDERRSAEHLTEQRAAQLVADPQAVLRGFEGLQGRHRRDKQKIADLETALKAATAKEAASAKALAKAKKDLSQTSKDAKAADRAATGKRAELTRKLGSAHGALEAYRAENARLKDDLHRVRGSRSMAIGRAVLSPASLMKRALGSSRATVQGSLAESGATSAQIEATAPAGASGASGAGAPAPAKKPSPQAQSAEPAGAAKAASTTAVPKTESSAPYIPVAQRSLASLVAEFEKDPTPKNLARVINRQWFTEGQITEPALLALENPELVTEMSVNEQKVIR